MYLPANRSALLLGLLVVASPSVAQKAQTFCFTQVAPAGEQPHSLQVLLKLDTLQQQRQNSGIAFSLLLRNASTSARVVENPLDFLIIRLTTTANLTSNIAYPAFYRRLAQPHSAQPVDYPVQALKIDSLTFNGLAADLNLTKVTELTIPAQTTLEIALRIPFVLKPNARKPYSREQTMAVPSDTYQLGLVLSIVAGPPFQDTRSLVIRNRRISYSK
jgi:hypothetical protein